MQPATKRNIATVKVERLDIDLLRSQRDALLGAIDDVRTASYIQPGGGQLDCSDQIECLDGLVNLLDHMIDTAEGFNV